MLPVRSKTDFAPLRRKARSSFKAAPIRVSVGEFAAPSAGGSLVIVRPEDSVWQRLADEKSAVKLCTNRDCSHQAHFEVCSSQRGAACKVLSWLSIAHWALSASSAKLRSKSLKFTHFVGVIG